MAIFKTPNGKGKYFDPSSKESLISYILNPQCILHSCFGGIHVDMDNIAESMHQVSNYFNKADGVQIRHFVISFHPAELDNPFIANEIAQQALCYLGKKYQAIYGVHENKYHLHIHIAMNSVSYVDGRRYYGTRAEFYAFRDFLQRLLSSYDIQQLQYVSNN